jgi:hypothetical protein
VTAPAPGLGGRVAVFFWFEEGILSHVPPYILCTASYEDVLDRSIDRYGRYGRYIKYNTFLITIDTVPVHTQYSYDHAQDMFTDGVPVLVIIPDIFVSRPHRYLPTRIDLFPLLTLKNPENDPLGVDLEGIYSRN